MLTSGREDVKINLLNILLFFIFLGFFFSFFFFSVTIVVCAIFFFCIICGIFSEIYLRRILNIQEKKDFIGEMLLLSVFIITAYWNTLDRNCDLSSLVCSICIIPL